MTLRQYNIIVNRFSDNIFRFILKNLSDRALAEDFTQDTFPFFGYIIKMSILKRPKPICSKQLLIW